MNKIEKKDKVKCIKNENYERVLIIGQIYTVYDIDENGLDIGYSNNFPEEYFTKIENKKYDLSEERSELSDIFWTKDMEIWELEDKIAEMNYIQKYWGDKLEEKLQQLKILKMAFEIWYDQTISDNINKLICNMDEKDKKDFIKNYSAQYKERRIITLIPETAKKYEEKQKEIFNLEAEIGKLKMTVESLKTKAINLAIINKNHQETIN